jgi:hypothetical protein
LQRHRARLRLFILLLLSTIPVGGDPLVDDDSLTVIRFAQVAAVPLLMLVLLLRILPILPFLIQTFL